MSQAAVEIEGLTHRYEDRVALEDLVLAVREGEIFGLLGPNGSGKTTLLRILSTLAAPTAGVARIFGADVVRESAVARRNFGVVFQSPSLDRKLTVAENLLHQGHLYGLRGGELRARIEGLLEGFGLADRARERVEKLSGGLARRAEIAKGLLHRPPLLLLDEPTTGLDPLARRDLWLHLRDVRAKDGTTVFAATHLLEEAEGFDRIAILDRGRLVAEGSPESLKGEIGGEVVTVEGSEPEKLRDEIASRLGAEGEVLDGKIRLERREGHDFAARLAATFGDRISAVSVRKPTLEDVFVRRTRREFAPRP